MRGLDARYRRMLDELTPRRCWGRCSTICLGDARDVHQQAVAARQFSSDRRSSFARELLDESEGWQLGRLRSAV